MTMKDLFYSVLYDARIAVDNGYWITIDDPSDNKAILDYGPIHSNGMQEKELVTITYELIAGEIVRNKMVHS